MVYHIFKSLSPRPQSGLRVRRTKIFKRQSRVNPEDREVRKQTSEPLPTGSSNLKTAPSPPTLQKHQSYPQYSGGKNRRARTHEQEVGSLLIRTIPVEGWQPTTTTITTTATASSTTTLSFQTVVTDSTQAQRASHTPAVRSGPPLSCNFCWNTVDECGRILRRKTQYHCPECRTNLCIVPCFHEYHDGPAAISTTSAR